MKKILFVMICCLCLYGCGNEKVKEAHASELKEGNISVKTLKNHFKDIYDNHNTNFISFDANFADNNFPYIDEIKYNYETITIEGNIKQGSNKVIYHEEYDINNNLIRIHFTELTTNDIDFTNSILAKISTMPSICDNSACSINVNKALLKTDIKSGECVQVDKWCISPTKSNTVNSYFLTKQDT